MAAPPGKGRPQADSSALAQGRSLEGTGAQQVNDEHARKSGPSILQPLNCQARQLLVYQLRTLVSKYWAADHVVLP
jgi:hypothetical protein